MEMYARKVVLLQVLKYMPKSIEVQRAVDVATAQDAGKHFTIDSDVVVIDERDDDQDGSVDQSTGEVRGAGATGSPAGEASPRADLPMCTPEKFDKNKAGWRNQIISKQKTVAELTAMIETRQLLTDDQKNTIHAWAHEND